MFTLKSIVLILIMGLAQSSSLICKGSTVPQEIVKVAEQLFGRSVGEHPYLFEINGEYVLTVDLNKSGELTKVEVLPKYFFQDLMPDWKQPDHIVGLTNNEYVNLLSKVAQLKSVGSVISEGKVGAVTNSKLWLLAKAILQDYRISMDLHDDSENDVSPLKMTFRTKPGSTQ
jgi:hypothetical protein